jgi:predicted NAD/FAD-dependent oxidoreductase
VAHRWRKLHRQQTVHHRFLWGESEAKVCIARDVQIGGELAFDGTSSNGTLHFQFE